MYENKPWLKFYGDIPPSIQYPDKSMYEVFHDSALNFSDFTAYEFMGKRASYGDLSAQIDIAAQALTGQGLHRGSVVTLCLPNCPQAIILFYALNKIGAIVSIIHPLSSPAEIKFFVDDNGSEIAAVLDIFYNKFEQIIEKTKLRKIIIVRIADYSAPLQRIMFYLIIGRKIKKPGRKDSRYLLWGDFLENSGPCGPCMPSGPDECAVILYSGGTTGIPKGIMLSNRNFNALGMQIAFQGPVIPGDTILSILPMFHGFGLGICIHTFLIKGGRCILMPNFTPESVAVLIRKKKPQYVAGVPTLFEALLRNKIMNRISLECLKSAYVGGDKLPQSIKERFDKLIKEQGGKAELLEGYGLTESVTGCIVTPAKRYRAGSMGIPLPDILAKIVIPGTCGEAQAGSDGELCISGPTVMLGYLNSPEDTDRILKKHDDGRLWLHTGDICSMDSDGYFYFKLRMKRIVKVSGISVSPVQVEDVLAGHPDIALSCVIGIPDEYKMQVLKAYVVLRDPSEASGKKEGEIIGFCRKNLNKWSVPAEVEFRKFLPLTKIGKVSYRDLEKENGL